MTFLTPYTTRRRSNLFTPFEGFFKDLDVFGDLNTRERAFTPTLNLSETKDAYILEAELPGVKKEDISVDINDSILTFKGEKKHNFEEKKDNFHVIERSYGSFQRSFTLPENVDAKQVDAKLEDGVLRIELKKSAVSNTSRKIEVL